MRFSQIDRITQLVEGQSLTAVKSISLSESYLQDHFPRFPVMPGVVMLESLFQASMWLFRTVDAFTHSMVVLRGAKNVRFRDLVEPGDQLVIETKLVSQDENLAEFSASGTVEGRSAVSGRLTLESYCVSERWSPTIGQESYMLNEFKRKFCLLLAPNLELSPSLRQRLAGQPGAPNETLEHVD